MFEFDEAVKLALRTWYSKDDPLHYNPHHPLGKLAAEWGELLDDYMKLVYKPDYQFNPLNELGDIWYYLRILAYQGGFGFYKMDEIAFPELDLVLKYAKASPDLIMAAMGYWGKQAFILHLTKGEEVCQVFINAQYSAIVEILNRRDLTINDLTRSNWEKLKPGSVRGDQWMKARQRIEYLPGGKIG